MNNYCSCDACRMGLDFITIRNALPKNLHETLYRIQSQLVHIEDDNGYYRALLKGSWPNSEEHMKHFGWQKCNKWEVK